MATVLGIEQGGTRFCVDGRPVFLLGASYYGGLGAPDVFVQQDMADLQRHGFNWIRVWCTWAACGRDVSVVDLSGSPRPDWMSRLQALCERADGAGLVVDVTFSRGDGVVSPFLDDHEAHLRAVRAVAERLRPFRNVYFDLGNERNLRDYGYVTFAELARLGAAVRELDPQRLVTASAANDIPVEDVGDYLTVAGVHFLAPHRPRTAESAGQTASKTREYLREAANVLGQPVPVHYQEPFRRDWLQWQPVAGDFLADLRGAIEGGAAGWCFHNGGCQFRDDRRPRRSFDMREEEGRLFDQLDAEERAVVERAAQVLRSA